jgi:prepilin-type N-terminal cleavage/methylation domain-containing protein
MVTVRKTNAGFTLTELMVVVVILSLLAALSTPLFTRDNNARRGRGWAQIVAQTLQRAHFQAMGDRASIHVKLYRTHITMEREDPPGTFTLLSSIQGPVADGVTTVAIWGASSTGDVPTNGTKLPSIPTSPPEIIFSSLGSTNGSANWKVYVANEMLPVGHPDAGFVVEVTWLTGYVSSSQMWTPS